MITREDFEDYEQSIELASTVVGHRRTRKALEYHLVLCGQSKYIVTTDGIVEYSGQDLNEAIRRYNNVQPDKDR